MATRLENPGDGNEGEVDDLGDLSASAREAAVARNSGEFRGHLTYFGRQ